MKKLYKLLKPSQDTTTLLLAYGGNFFLALSSCSRDLEPWVIDSRAIDHMMGYEKFSHHIILV